MPRVPAAGHRIGQEGVRRPDGWLVACHILARLQPVPLYPSDVLKAREEPAFFLLLTLLELLEQPSQAPGMCLGGGR